MGGGERAGNSGTVSMMMDVEEACGKDSSHRMGVPAEAGSCEVQDVLAFFSTLWYESRRQLQIRYTV